MMLPDNIFEQRFLIRRQLGAGAFGVVYEALDRNLNRPVAIKVLNATFQPGDTTVHRFLREGQILAKLASDHLVQLFFVGLSAQRQLYMVMELLGGETLRSALQNNQKFSEQKALHVARQVACALDVLSVNGIAHRDLKPDNIMLLDNSEKPPVKVLDLGLAGLIDRRKTQDPQLTPDGMVVGSVHYIAPEACLGDKADIKADFYALGCILHECLTGKPPFDGTGIADIFLKHVNDVPEEPEASERTQNVVTCLLQKKPQMRYRNTAELLSALDDAMEKTGLIAEQSKASVTVGRRTMSWFGSRRSGGAAALILTIVSTATALFAYQSKHTAVTPSARISEMCDQFLRQPITVERVSSFKTELSNILQSRNIALSIDDTRMFRKVLLRLRMTGHLEDADQLFIVFLDDIKNNGSAALCPESDLTPIIQDPLCYKTPGKHLTELLIYIGQNVPVRNLVGAGPCFEHLVSVSVQNKDFTAAEKAASIAARLYKEAANYERIALIYSALGYYLGSDRSHGAKYWKLSVEYFARCHSHRLEYANALGQYADYLCAQKNYAEQRNCLITMCGVLKSQSKLPAWFAEHAADIYWQLPQEPQDKISGASKALGTEVIAILKPDCSSSDSNVRTNALIRLGMLYDRVGEYDEATKQLEVLRKVNPEACRDRMRSHAFEMADNGRSDGILFLEGAVDRADALVRCAGYFLRQDKFRETRKCLLDAALLLKALKDVPEPTVAVWATECLSLNKSAPSYALTAEFRDITEKRILRLETQTETGPPAARAHANIQIASLNNQLGEKEKGIEYVEKAYNVVQKYALHDAPGETFYLRVMVAHGRHLASIGQWSSACMVLKKVVADPEFSKLAKSLQQGCLSSLEQCRKEMVDKP